MIRKDEIGEKKGGDYLSFFLYLVMENTPCGQRDTFQEISFVSYVAHDERNLRYRLNNAAVYIKQKRVSIK